MTLGCVMGAHVVYNGDCLHEARRPSDCGRVAEGAPILHVSHEADGDWQFLCSGQHEDDGDDGALVVCLEHMVVGDPSLNELAHMCRGFYADRAAQGDSWVVTDEGEEFDERRPADTCSK